MKHIFTSGFCLAFILQLFAYNLYGQVNPCAWRPPLMADKHMNKISPFTGAGKANDNDSVYTLPVVVHIIHTGGAIGTADNPSDSLVNEMLANLNKAWRRNGSQYGGADMKIQFALAKKSPACIAASGINRIDAAALPAYASGGITNFNVPGSVPEEIVKKLSRWPNTDYINIWIVNKINGSAVAPGGYAYFPEYNSAITDGLVLLAGVVNGTNKTIVHEMGHYFSLYHSFYDDNGETNCPSAANCALTGDRVCDTEPCIIRYDCSNTTNSCTGNPYQLADIAKGYTVLNNYMGYTDCQWMFTDDQKARARAALFLFRNGLISSGAFKTATQLLPASTCVPVPLYGFSPYYGVEKVELNDLHVYSNTSGADSSFYVDRSCNQSTILVKGQTYALTVTGSYQNPHRIKVFIDYNNNGNLNEAGEMVLSAYDGQASASVTIPVLSTVPVNMPLRLRVVADNPTLPEPGPCNLTGTAAEGAGQIEDYSVIVVPRQVWSVASGSWNSTATWSCNCIPASGDEVIIKANHTISLSGTAGSCSKLSLEPGSVFNGGSNLKIDGPQ